MLAHPFMLLTPQAKLLVSVLSSTNLVIPRESYPLLPRIFYIRVRMSSRPSSILIDSAVVSLSHLLAIEFGSKKSPEFLSESVLLLGAFSFVPSGLPDVLAGIGYALCSLLVHYVRILNALLGIWGKKDGPLGEVANICLRDFRHFKDTLFSIFAMAAAGVLRASNRSPPSDEEDNSIVENMMWRFCQELYSEHRQVAFLLHGKADELLEDILLSLWLWCLHWLLRSRN
ncbi:hypothetical protein DKX38_016657 [Salix brachista]|uniref:Uncharacterized protein n=1 Tax=Salix brachista TaxID=2182728 RepID=A0A5N5L8M5_9ROSI|nr:hypothetical protein DKX38_016657 [Salix brachista]